MMEESKTQNQEQAYPYQRSPKDRKRPSAVLILLVVLLAAAVAYIFYSQNEYNTIIEDNRTRAIEELSALQEEYDTLNVHDAKLRVEIDQAQTQIAMLKDSMVNYKATVGLLRSYENQIKRLREEKRELFHVADSLNRLNKVLIAQRDRAEDSLRKTSSKNQILVEQNTRMQQDIQSAATLDARAVKAQAVSVSRNGKLSDTDRAKRTDQIRVSFTLSKNTFANSGPRTIYVRVVSPSKLIGIEKGNNFFAAEGERLQFSGAKEVIYENGDLDVSVFVDGVAGDFVEGKYSIYVYADNRSIGSCQLLLK